MQWRLGKAKISFIIITLNDGENLWRYQSSQTDVSDEFVLVDSGSTDTRRRWRREHGGDDSTAACGLEKSYLLKESLN